MHFYQCPYCDPCSRSHLEEVISNEMLCEHKNKIKKCKKDEFECKKVLKCKKCKSEFKITKDILKAQKRKIKDG